MESTNKADDGNQMTLHTTGGCSMDVRRKDTGKALQKNCNHEKSDNAGCGVKSEADGFGTAFNKNGGGVMAVEWRDEGIRMWQFARNSIPSDIKGNKPTPSTWGTALADFPNTDCNIGSHFKNQSIIANIDLCGSLVYSVWDNSGCKFIHLVVVYQLLTESQVLEIAQTSLQTILKRSRMLTGSLVLSKYTKQSEPEKANRFMQSGFDVGSAALREKGGFGLHFWDRHLQNMLLVYYKYTVDC